MGVEYADDDAEGGLLLLWKMQMADPFRQHSARENGCTVVLKQVSLGCRCWM